MMTLGNLHDVSSAVGEAKSIACERDGRFTVAALVFGAGEADQYFP